MRPEGHLGFRTTYAQMMATGELEGFSYLTPRVTAARHGQKAALDEVRDEARALQPDVILVATPASFGHDASWVARLLGMCGRPAVVYWEGDLWHPWAKPPSRSMEAWLRASDIVFTPARSPQTGFFRRRGARDVRLLPHTYCQEVFAEAERTDPLADRSVSFDAVMIGGRLGHWGGFSRVPGAWTRARLVRMLQRRRDLRIAIYGGGWSGRGAMGVLPFPQQTSAIRTGLMSVNWDHFPRHESYASNRLAISLVAGRVHVTTAHRGLEWAPDATQGLFLEHTVSDVVDRVLDLSAAPPDEILALGARAHAWARGRMSDRSAARFMLGAIDRRFLDGLPAKPWLDLAGEWPS